MGSWVRRLRLVARRADGRNSVRGWLLASLRTFVVSFLALAVTFRLLPGEQVTRGAWSVAGLAVGVLLVGALLRPLIVRLTAMTGAVGLFIAGVLTQAVVLGVALAVVPTIDPFTMREVFVAAWASAAVAAVVNWLFDAGSEEVFFAQVLGQAIRESRRNTVTGSGLLVIQLDGVSEPLLRQAITAGSMPAVARLLRSGSHRLRDWHTGLPATTPAGQAVLMHGDESAVPGFRWYDKQLGRVVTCGRAADVAGVERQLSDGRGLLADGGASVSNLFSGDAPIRTLTVSDPRVPSDAGAVSFAVGRAGFVRSIVLFAGQVIAEWYQGRRQRLRDVRPRVSRLGAFLLLRGLTTVVLRDLNVSVVAQQMAQGTPTIYVDFVDYDEVAHHAGPSRPESMRTLEGLDRVVDFFLDLDSEVGRDYEIVLVSDHGQAQGTPFRQLAGRTLDQVVHELTDRAVVAGEASTESETWMPASVLLGEAGHRSVLARGVSHLVSGRGRKGAETRRPVTVAAGGSLAHVYLTDQTGRVTRPAVDRCYRGLVTSLAAQPGIGAVIVREDDGSLTAHGRAGWTRFGAGGIVETSGVDPLAVYGDRARDDLVALDQRANVGDLVLLGSYDRGLGEVTAFEELVGSHGGLGGWQTRALLVHPADWALPPERLHGRDVHAALLARLGQLGLRSEPRQADPVEIEVDPDRVRAT